MEKRELSISVVVPTLRRPGEIEAFLQNLCEQDVLPFEVIVVDGAPEDVRATESVVERLRSSFAFDLQYMRQQGGTAVQRNAGIDLAQGSLIALLDDDVRLTPGFLKTMADVFVADGQKNIGGVVGYRINRHFEIAGSQRWRLYKRLKLLSVFEPGRYDFACGYPINNNLQPPFTGTREVDFMTTACAVWRRQVFDSGLRFSPFFTDYGVLEDAHLSLKARSKWKLMQCGDAHCEELHSPNGRVSRRRIGFKCVVNYYFVFIDIVGPLSVAHKWRFWRFQAFEFLRVGAWALRRLDRQSFLDLIGRVQGVLTIALFGNPGKEFVDVVRQSGVADQSRTYNGHA
ncbi:MAG: glycosyltransferase family 2 protein [Acidobacteria bacterium]|nr:glycosyltransferase family 2 protein [Acidobacteriota bacterium]